jgi:hypothetical protein
MNPNTDNLSPQQSLDIITKMIGQAKGNIRENSFYYLFWGWVLVIVNIGVFTLIQLNVPYAHATWIIIVPAWIITIIYSARRVKRSRVATHLDQITMTLWFSFGIIALTIPLLGKFINYQINPMILLAGSVATVTSGAILRYNPLKIGGVIIFLCGLLSFFVSEQWQPLIAAFAIAVGYIVPGYQLKWQN